jgi:hypothetical protein
MIRVVTMVFQGIANHSPNREGHDVDLAILTTLVVVLPRPNNMIPTAPVGKLSTCLMNTSSTPYIHNCYYDINTCISTNTQS